MPRYFASLIYTVSRTTNTTIHADNEEDARKKLAQWVGEIDTRNWADCGEPDLDIYIEEDENGRA